MRETTNRKYWKTLHQDSRHRTKYPAEKVVQFVFRNFERSGKERVLDLGCGAGRHVVFMGKEKIIPYGIDFSDEGISYTKEMLQQYGMKQYVDNMQVGTIEKLPYRDNFFDGIICYGVLYYLSYEKINQVIAEIKRVLKKDGKFLIVVRSIEDYRYNKKNEMIDNKHTVIIQENDENKCAYSENGMLMHFFDDKEIKKLFSEFNNLKIDFVKESHDNQKFYDCNYILVGEK